MYVNNIESEMFLPPGSESFNHNATRTTSSRSRSNNVNNNIVPVYTHVHHGLLYSDMDSRKRMIFSVYSLNDIFMCVNCKAI